MLSADCDARAIMPVTETSILALADREELLGPVRITSLDLARVRRAPDRATLRWRLGLSAS